jgi:hypothetical protein
MKDGRAPRALCLVVAALVAGCTSTSSPSPSPPDPTPPPGATTLGAVQTAADVAKPATAISGVWSVVAHLHLAVYGAGPTTLLAGTDQPTSDGVYLYGAEIPLLAVGRRPPAKPRADHSDARKVDHGPVSQSRGRPL